jgi:hypothetical protein
VIGRKECRLPTSSLITRPLSNIGISGSAKHVGTVLTRQFRVALRMKWRKPTSPCRRRSLCEVAPKAPERVVETNAFPPRVPILYVCDSSLGKMQRAIHWVSSLDCFSFSLLRFTSFRFNCVRREFLSSISEVNDNQHLKHCAFLIAPSLSHEAVSHLIYSVHNFGYATFALDRGPFADVQKARASCHSLLLGSIKSALTPPLIHLLPPVQ